MICNEKLCASIKLFFRAKTSVLIKYHSIFNFSDVLILTTCTFLFPFFVSSLTFCDWFLNFFAQVFLCLLFVLLPAFLSSAVKTSKNDRIFVTNERPFGLSVTTNAIKDVKNHVTDSVIKFVKALFDKFIFIFR